MKKHIRFFVMLSSSFLFFTSSLTQAQFNQGNWLVEGTIGQISLSNYSDKAEQTGSTNKYERDSFGFRIYPSTGYFISNNFVIGLKVGFNYYSNKDKSFNSDGFKTYESKNSSSQISIAPFLRFYLPGNKSLNLRFYGQVGGGIIPELSSSYESTSYSTDGLIIGKDKQNSPEKYFQFFLEGLIGLNYFLTKNVALNGALGYTYEKSTETISYTYIDINGDETKYPDIKYTDSGNYFTWNMGFTMIIP